MNARSADTADAHDLVSHVDDVELLEQVLAIVLQRVAVGPELIADHVFHLVHGQTSAGDQVS